MKLKIQQPPFGENSDDPFANDLLNRKQEIEDLTPMIKNVLSPTVMALDAPWGAGKTAFIKMWAAYLNKEGMPAFYFNAWETDFAADPLLPFVEKITEQLPEENQGNLMDSAKALIPMVLGSVVHAAGYGIIAKIAEYFARNLFTHHSKLAKFKKALGEFAKSQTNKHIVIFVDELDRCRPDYAVKVLERIKHLFEVPSVVFVLATNREQLCHSVKGLYGASFDAGTYLRRFIEFDFTIKQPDTGSFIHARLSVLGVEQSLGDSYGQLHNALTLLASVYNYSLRDVEQLLMRVLLVLSTLEDKPENKHPVYPILLAFLVVARQEMPAHYQKYIRPDDNGEEMVKHWEDDLKKAGIYERDDNSTVFPVDSPISLAASVTACIAMVKFFTRGGFPNDSDFSTFLAPYEEKIKTAATTSEREYRDRLVQEMWGSRHLFDREILPQLVKKIEIQDRFRFPASGDSEGNQA